MLVLDTPAGLSALVASGGLALLLVIERVPAAVPVVIRVIPPVLVILSMTLVGHATSRGMLTGMLLALHLAGIGFWFAALLPLRRMCGDPMDEGGAAHLASLAEEFGRLALVLVAMLVVAGLCYASLLLGSVAALFTSAYGQVRPDRTIPACNMNRGTGVPRRRQAPESIMEYDRFGDHHKKVGGSRHAVGDGLGACVAVICSKRGHLPAMRRRGALAASGLYR